MQSFRRTVIPWRILPHRALPRSTALHFPSAASQNAFRLYIMDTSFPRRKERTWH